MNTRKAHAAAQREAQGGSELDRRVTSLLSPGDVWDMTLPWLPEQQDLEILRRFRASGFTFVSTTTEDFPPTFDGVKTCIERFKAVISGESSWLATAHSLADIDEGRKSGKLVIGFNVQDTVQLETELARVELLHSFGVRHMVLAYNTRNYVADGCAEPTDAGLSLFGRRVVREMNRVGIVVDCSHTGYRSSLDAIEISSTPTIFSHSGAYAVCAHIRNIRDEQIRACAARGGVIGIVGIGAFIGDPQARAESVFRHIDHVAGLVGPQHIGLGTDYVKDMGAIWQAIQEAKDSSWPDPTGTQLYEGECFQPEQLRDLVRMMLTRGYPTAAVLGILGGNFRRVYASAEDRRAKAGI